MIVRRICIPTILNEKLRATLILENFQHHWGYITAQMVVEFLIQTGLRNQELCQLNLNDLDMANQRLYLI